LRWRACCRTSARAASAAAESDGAYNPGTSGCGNNEPLLTAPFSYVPGALLCFGNVLVHDCAGANLVFGSGDSHLKWTGVLAGVHFIHSRASIHVRDGDFGTHPPLKCGARSFFRHPETHGYAIQGLARLVRDLDDDPARYFRTGRVHGAFAFEYPDIQQ
jgi:hypothetical protein